MPAVVSPFVLLYQWIGTYGGRPWVNTMHTVWSADGADRSIANLSDAALSARVAWSANIAQLVPAEVVLQEVRVTDLDSLDGQQGSDVVGSAGTNSGQASAPNVSVLVTKATQHGRSQRNGRWYQIGMPEESTSTSDPGLLLPTPLGNWGLRFAEFLTAMSADVATFTNVPVVLSKSPTTPGAFVPNNIISMTVEELLATQRRRLRG